MRGHEQVITLLNEVLTAELTAINQYFIHGRMCENWGYERLWKKLREESIGEMKHADELIERILYLEGVPNVQRLGKVNVARGCKQKSKNLRSVIDHYAIEILRGNLLYRCLDHWLQCCAGCHHMGRRRHEIRVYKFLTNLRDLRNL